VSLQPLRCHVGDRALAVVQGTALCRQRIETAGQAKIQDPDAARRFDHQVGGLEITVRQQGPMGFVHCFGHLAHDVQCQRLGLRQAAGEVAQRRPAHQFHDDGLAFSVVVNGVDLHERGMVQRGGQLPFRQQRVGT